MFSLLKPSLWAKPPVQLHAKHIYIIFLMYATVGSMVGNE